MNKLTNEQRCILNLHLEDAETAGDDGDNFYFTRLVIKTAQLITACDVHDRFLPWYRLGEAIATNNIADIEALCYELMGEGL